MAEPVQLTNQDPLSGLADIVVPDPVSWFPQTWGWWVLAGLILLAILLLTIRWARRFAANRYRREALKQCAQLENVLDDDNGRAAALAELATLLKRTALSAWPRADVASLSGQEWIDFLRLHGPGADMDDTLAQLLAVTEYRPDSLESVSRSDARACARAVSGWIGGHRVSA